jgi:putative copper resistance protein D
MGDLALALARAMQMTGSFGVFGTLLFAAARLPPGAEPAGALRRLVWWCLGLGVAAGLVWFVLQSADMAGATDLSETVAAFPVVALSTRFGHLLVLRLVLLAAAGVCLQRGQGGLGAGLAGLAVAAEAGLDHGAAMGGGIGAVLFVSAALHLLAGAAWLGSLPALLLTVRHLPVGPAAGVLRRYSPMGVACVLTMLATAVVQFFFLVASPAALVESVYGRVAAYKIIALALLIALASLNRFRLGPALLKTDSKAARQKILCSIGLEIAIGLSALLAAGVLMNLAPPTMATMQGMS